jgi:tetratricopeptide (TPR) repeat protein
MKRSYARNSLRFACLAAAAFLVCAKGARAQNSPFGGGAGQGIPNQTQIGQSGGTMNDQLQYGTMGHQVEREQDAAYNAFFKEQVPAKKIQLGNSFLQKYAKSPLVERVDFGMMNAYRAQQDWKNTFRFADSALALNADDVDVLATMSWTMAHVYNPGDPGADQELSKAETCAKHAIEVLGKLHKPPDLTEAQFEAAIAKRSFQAHSALGLVYFRRNDYENSAKELQQSTKDNPTPDATDLFVLGVDLQNLSRYSEAAETFRGCSQFAGPLQDRCKQGADAMKAQADQSTGR